MSPRIPAAWLAAAIGVAALCPVAEPLAAPAPSAEARPVSPASRRSSGRRRRRRPRRPPASRPGLVILPEARLQEGRWLEANRRALEEFLTLGGKGTEGYSELEPPTAMFVLEDAAMSHWVGESLFGFLVDRAGFKFSPEFWRLVPEAYGRERLRAGQEGFREVPAAARPRDAFFQLYRKGFHKAYRRMCAEHGGRECARWLAALLAGLSAQEVARLSRELLTLELERAFGEEAALDSPEDPEPLRVPVGLRRVPEIEDLIRRLLDRGFDVWLLSRANQWSAEAAAELYGIHPSRVVGVRSKVADGVILAETLDPVAHGTGQAEALAMFLGDPPDLAVGGAEDLALLESGLGLRLLLAPRAEDLAPEPAPWLAKARRRGWLVQPAFSPAREPQK